MKKFVFVLLCLIIICTIFYLFDDKDACLDTGYCKENQIVNTEFGKVLINKNNCLKYKWEWNDIKKTCKLK